MFTINNIDARMTLLKSSVFILNLEQFSHFIPLLTLRSSLLGQMISQTKPLQINFYLPFNFTICCDKFSRGWNKNRRHIVSTIPSYVHLFKKAQLAKLYNQNSCFVIQILLFFLLCEHQQKFSSH